MLITGTTRGAGKAHSFQKTPDATLSGEFMLACTHCVCITDLRTMFTN